MPPPCAVDMLASVRIALQYGAPAIASLSEIARQISSCLDTSHEWTLERASMAGHVALLDRLAAREWPGVCTSFRTGRFLYAVHRATAHGKAEVLAWWMTKYGLEAKLDIMQHIIRIAAYQGHLNVLKWVFRDDDKLQLLDDLDEPLKCLNAEVTRWIVDRKPDARLEISLNLAARDGDLEFIKWVYGHRDRFPVAIGALTMDFAAEHGHLDVLKWLMENAPDTYSPEVLDCAARGGHTHIMSWLVRNVDEDEHPMEDPSPNSVLKSGSVDVMKWVIESVRLGGFDEDDPSYAVKEAAGNGHWELLKYICARGLEVTAASF